MKIIVKNLQKIVTISPAKIKLIARRVKRPPKFNHLELSLYFVKNSVIKKLNKRFFAQDCLTDVISFNLDKDYAEVFIAPSVVKINAAQFRVSLNEELCRCVIHGLLHIFGFRDGSKKEKARMWRKQEAELKKIICNAKG